MTEDNKTELLLGNLTPEAVDRIKALVDEFEAKGQPISVGETIDLNEGPDVVALLLDNGAPQQLDLQNAMYRSYFENEHSDQWILWEDMGGVNLAGADIGWENGLIFGPEILQQTDIHIGLVMTNAERAWLLACFTAVKHKQGHERTRPLCIYDQPSEDPALRPLPRGRPPQRKRKS